MREDTSRDVGLQREESLEDLVYRARLSQGRHGVRKASAWLSLPLTLAGYAVLGLLGWKLVSYSRVVIRSLPVTVTVDLTDIHLPEEPKEDPAPKPAPAPSGAPPAGALQKPDAPPPRVHVTPDVPPEKPPQELPKGDLSNVAFPAVPPGTPPGNGLGGPGVGTGPGGDGLDDEEDEPETTVIKRINRALKVRSKPESPPYPPMAKRAGIQGTVKVEVRVGKDGVPLSATALEGPMPLRSAARAFAMQYRYEPEIENGEAVEAYTYVSVTFRLTGS